jgi:hypothetical protein
LGTLRGRYDEHISKSFLSMKLRSIEPVGERTNFRRLMLAGLATAPDNLYMVPYLGRSFFLREKENILNQDRVTIIIHSFCNFRGETGKP